MLPRAGSCLPARLFAAPLLPYACPPLPAYSFACECGTCASPPAPDAQVWAPTPRYQMPGITRRKVLELCRAAGIPVRELDFALTQVCAWVGHGWTRVPCLQAHHSTGTACQH